MPNGRAHDIITITTTPVVGFVTYQLTKDIKTTGIILSLFLFSSFMFNGDLDTNSRPYNRWWLLKMIWIPYQLMFNHRSIFTHGLIIGTIIRVLYVGIIPFIYFLFKGNLQIITSIGLSMWLIIFIGLELGSAIHTISDKIF
ncbi:MAG: metal-binding protein [Ignavibacteriales bacterium]|nr:metal-binding protein [Ignavibacteriales bacterium]